MSCQLFPLDFITLIIIGETYKAPVPLKPISTLFPAYFTLVEEPSEEDGKGTDEEQYED
jgi:hypothetical protein